MKFNESISIIIPAFDEEEIIEDVVKYVYAELSNLFNDFELILIDDHSTDNTYSILEKLRKQYKNNILTHQHENNLGVGCGIKSGIKLATKDYTMTNFADLPFKTSDLKFIFPKLIEENADGCIVVRKNRSANSLFRKFTSYINYVIIKLLFGTPFKDFQFVQIYKTNLLKKLNIESSDLFVPPEIMFKLNEYGYNIIQYTTTFHKRPGGEAKYGKIKYFIQALYSHLRYFVRFRIFKIHLKDMI